ncbi:hypothetical protein [Sulfitobacter sp. R18_1]|uniref:hypothetical protein n=1 Tax=Sulfitobacter sp. R18_1 TaxID=2821104 RepID=UPI001ADCD8DD|nr:hypothetical protein [Sulfitobacter sp. R18_1]MBO9428257.1 hypothetical protein [Sulfitobacter sp. R18_1]
MKIIHGRDYYDFAHAGIDETVTFVRDGDVVNLEGDENPFRLEGITKGLRHISLFGAMADNEGNYLVFEPILVFVAGVTYPALRFAKANKYADQDYLEKFTLYYQQAAALYYGDTEIVYDRERAMELAAMVDPKKARDFAFGKGKRTIEQIINDHFAVAHDRYTEFLVENKIVTGFAYNHDSLLSKDVDRAVLYKNIDFLDALQFPTVMDGFTLNQEIFRFISGVLPSPGASTVEIEDKYRIRKGGFDPKYGFRTRPKK